MKATYSQWNAMLAISRASIIGMFRSPSAVIFSFAFPLVFILVFGFLGGGGGKVRVAVDPQSDLGNVLFTELRQHPRIQLEFDKPYEQQLLALQRGQLAACLQIQRVGQDSITPVQLITSSAGGSDAKLVAEILQATVSALDDKRYPRPSMASIKHNQMEGRLYRPIDFILPGQLGFSLLSAAIFGTAFLFFSLRQTLVLKRFFATPIKRIYIILGEAISRLVFQSIGAIIIIAMGYWVFNFTLVNGWVTFVEMLLLCLFGLIVFMGFGFIVSGVAKSESSIPPIANVITMPQFLLAGTFFSIDVFPTWLQPICKLMPLTYLNDALRKVAFEGLHLWQLGPELLVLTGWGLLAYAVAVKFFRWE
jgi:ABC-2 type transport system permease protein